MRKKVLCLALAAIVSLGGCAKAPADKGGSAPGSAAKPQSSQASASAPDNKPAEAASGSASQTSAPAPEETYEFQGKAGENVNWYYKDGVLLFKGTGDMSHEILLGEDSNYGYENQDMMEKITSIVIEKGVTSICDFMFGAGSFNSNLTDVTIPEGVTSIGIGAFAYCENLKSIDLPDSITEIGGGAFVACGFDEATFTKIEEMYPGAFDPSVFNQ